MAFGEPVANSSVVDVMSSLHATERQAIVSSVAKQAGNHLGVTCVLMEDLAPVVHSNAETVGLGRHVIKQTELVPRAVRQDGLKADVILVMVFSILAFIKFRKYYNNCILYF